MRTGGETAGKRPPHRRQPGPDLSGDQVLRLGGRLHRIGAEQLRLEGGELAAYVHRCGAALNQEQLAELQQATEGWMAAVYLRLRPDGAGSGPRGNGHL